MTQHSNSIAPTAYETEEQLTFTTAGETSSELVNWFVRGLRETIIRLGHVYRDAQESLVRDDQAAEQHRSMRADQLVRDHAADDRSQVRQARVPAVQRARLGLAPPAPGVEALLISRRRTHEIQH